MTMKFAVVIEQCLMSLSLAGLGNRIKGTEVFFGYGFFFHFYHFWLWLRMIIYPFIARFLFLFFGAGMRIFRRFGGFRSGPKYIPNVIIIFYHRGPLFFVVSAGAPLVSFSSLLLVNVYLICVNFVMYDDCISNYGKSSIMHLCFSVKPRNR